MAKTTAENPNTRPKCEVRLICYACGKPPSTTFSKPLQQCSTCRKHFHGDCQGQASEDGADWYCSLCTRRKTRHAEVQSSQAEAVENSEVLTKRRKTENTLLEKQNWELNQVIADARNDPPLENAIRQAVNRAVADIRKEQPLPNSKGSQPPIDMKSQQASQLSSFLSGQAKELSPPYSPQELPDRGETRYSSSNVGVQANLPEPTPAPIRHWRAHQDDKMATPLDGLSDTEDIAPTRSFPCSQCKRNVIRNPTLTICAACKPQNIRPESEDDPCRPLGVVLNYNPFELEQSPGASEKERMNIDVPPYGSDAGWHHSLSQPTESLKVCSKHQRLKESPEEEISQNIRADTFAHKVSQWQEGIPYRTVDLVAEEQIPEQLWSASVAYRDEGSNGPALSQDRLYERLRKSNQEKEDLKTHIKNMETSHAEAMKERTRVLKEKNESLAQIQKALEQNRKVGQRKIQKLESENKELVRLQKQSQFALPAQKKDSAEEAVLRRKSQKLESENTDLGSMNARLQIRAQSLEEEVRELKRKANKATSQQRLLEKFKTLKQQNAMLKRKFSAQKHEIARKASSPPRIPNEDGSEQIERATDRTAAKYQSPVPDIRNWKPAAHLDWLSGLPLGVGPFDVAARRREIAQRPGRKHEGRITLQNRRERGEHLHTKALRWHRPIRDLNHDFQETSRPVVAVEVPRDELSSEERSLYNSYVFPTPAEDVDSHRVAPAGRKRRRAPNTDSDASAESSADGYYVNSSPSSSPSLPSRLLSRVNDVPDLSTRGAPLRSSSPGQTRHLPHHHQQQQHQRLRIAHEDPDASPPPPLPTSRNERLMAELKAALGVPAQARPALRNSKLYMEEVRAGDHNNDDEEDSEGENVRARRERRRRRPRRIRAWAVE